MWSIDVNRISGSDGYSCANKLPRAQGLRQSEHSQDGQAKSDKTSQTISTACCTSFPFSARHFMAVSPIEENLPQVPQFIWATKILLILLGSPNVAIRLEAIAIRLILGSPDVLPVCPTCSFFLRAKSRRLVSSGCSKGRGSLVTWA